MIKWLEKQPIMNNKINEVLDKKERDENKRLIKSQQAAAYNELVDSLSDEFGVKNLNNLGLAEGLPAFLDGLGNWLCVITDSDVDSFKFWKQDYGWQHVSVARFKDKINDFVVDVGQHALRFVEKNYIAGKQTKTKKHLERYLLSHKSITGLGANVGGKINSLYLLIISKIKKVKLEDFNTADAVKYMFFADCDKGLSLKTGKIVKMRKRYLTDVRLQIKYSDINRKSTGFFARHLKNLFSEEQEFAFGQMIVSAIRGGIHQKVMSIYGSGGSGKSTALNAVASILDDRLIVNLLKSQYHKTSNDVFGTENMLNARILLATEYEANRQIDWSFFKVITGDDHKTAINIKFKQPIYHRIMAMPILIGNSLPKINDNDNATKRRLILLESNTKIDEPLTNQKIRAKIKKDRSGIFQWLLEHIQAMHENKDNLIIPEEIITQSTNLIKGNDPTQAILINSLLEAFAREEDRYVSYIQLAHKFNAEDRKKWSPQQVGYKARQYGFDTKRVKEIDTEKDDLNYNRTTAIVCSYKNMARLGLSREDVDNLIVKMTKKELDPNRDF